MSTDSISRTLNEKWEKLTIKEREQLITKLAGVIPGCEEVLWDGLSIETLSRTKDPDDLPSNVRGLLICALNDEGFSIKKITIS
jgi:hypothetical protein